MKEYLIKRLLMNIPTVLGITVVVLLAMRLIPGDPIDLLLADDYSDKAREVLMREDGLDQPIHIQYVKWIWQMLQGNWGASILTDRPVLPDVLMKLPVSIELILFVMLFSLLIAVPAGIISATKPYSARDYTAMTTALVGNSVPDFFVGILLVLLFSHTLRLLPVNGFVWMEESLWQNLRHILLPAAALGFARAAILVEASLSFLGLGTQPPTPSWGYDLKASVPLIQINPWLSIFPGVAILLTVLGFNLFGDGLRDALDPRLKQ